MKTLPLMLLALHFVADFVLQNDWMAVNKSKRWDALTLHVAIYSLVIAIGVNWRAFFLPFGTRAFNEGQIALMSWYLLTFATHFVTDALTSRATSALWFFQREDGIWVQAEYAFPKHGRTIVNPWSPIEGKRHWFFVMMGFDQLIHAATLAWTFSLVMA